MSESQTCAGCGGKMEEGFIFDRGHLNYAAEQQWVEGEPESSFWSGIKTGGKRLLNIVTYRCEQCGRLESYAREPTS